MAAREKHPLYKKWCWHKRGVPGMAPDWRSNFWQFVEDVGDPPAGHQLRRLNAREPIGPGNFEWREPINRGDQKSRADRAAYMREYRKRYPDIVRNVDLKKAFGITVADYDRMLERQGGVCAICGCSESQVGRYKRLAVDHCHDTGAVRGLLCNNCNRAIGFLNDDPDRVRSALDYLSSY